MTKHIDDLGLTIDIIAPLNESTIGDEPLKDTKSLQETRIGVYRFMLANLTLPYPDGRVFHYHIDRQVRTLVDRAIRRLRAVKVKIIEYDLSPVEVVKMLHSMYNKSQMMWESVSECSDACRKESVDKYLMRLGQDAPHKNIDSIVNSPSMPEMTRKSLLSIDSDG